MRAFLALLLLSCGDPSARDGDTAVLGGSSAALVVASTVTVPASGDTWIKQGSTNKNFGSEATFELSSSGRNRAIVLFNAASLASAVGSSRVVSAHLELSISESFNNWGMGRAIGAYRLKQHTTEYDATFSCAVDSNVYNSNADCSGTNAWTMWGASNPSLHPWYEPVSATASIQSAQSGNVRFDITADVLAILAGGSNHGWLIKKVDEGLDGRVAFHTRERSLGQGPRIVLVLETDEEVMDAGVEPRLDAGVSASFELAASKDSFVRDGAPNTNEGASTILRIQSSGKNRAVVAFDGNAIRAASGTLRVASATLQLAIDTTYNNWGDDRAVGVHRLKQDFREHGATWNCADDSNPANSSSDCSGSAAWAMSPSSTQAWDHAPLDVHLVQSGETGSIEWDVSHDVACVAAGHLDAGLFLIKKEAEQLAGQIDFISTQGGIAPTLIVQLSNDAPTPSAEGCGSSIPDGGTCSPTASTDTSCNGVDDDCDGQIDEDFAVQSTSCGLGACVANGLRTCLAGIVVDSCHPTEPAASDASCNGIDEDCNGGADEDYVPVSSVCGVGACAAQGMTACVAGSATNSCTPGTPAAQDATCNGVDDDCNGSADEDFASAATICGIGACQRQGATSCSGGTVLDSCATGPAALTDATCDGLDNDCDGHADEEFLGQPTECGVGACAATGVTSCVSGAVGDSCLATPAPSASDATCDGIDDDCDGIVDEDYEALPASCGLGACAATGTTSCVEGEVLDSCVEGPAGGPDSDCDAVDDDCDGVADDEYVAVATSCGQGVCASTGTRTCEEGELHDSCTPFEPSAAADALCDGLDQDCNGEADEDYAAVETACGIGACGSSGTTNCVAGEVVDSCQPGAPAASDATCDSVDDDCSGQSDEDYLAVPTACAVGACAATGATSCSAGHVVDSCVPGTPAAVDDSCDGIDDDCSGVADEDYAPLPTSCGVGACSAVGLTTCVAAEVVDTCSPGAPAAVDVTCDGADDNCNGAADEDYVSEVTTCGVGACANVGATSCVSGAVVNACTPSVASADDATCDGRDDDCDGQSDEDYESDTIICGMGACQRTGTTSCEQGRIVEQCTSGTPAASDTTCDSIDDNCNGLTDEGYVESATSCGVAACANTGFIICSGGQQEDTCTPGTPGGTDGCGNGDEDCDGIADEDCCQPSTCNGVGANCGEVADGCGGMIDCGSCEAPETCGGAGISNVCGVAGLPPDPADVAPPLPPGGSPSVYDSVSFLFTGPNPIQQGVEPGAITPRRVATVNARVIDRDGDPLPGARIAVHDHPELGFTLSRANGEFDLVLNGGGQVTLEVSRPGYLSVQRTVPLDWESREPMDDIALIRPSPVAAVIDSHATTLQTFEAESITDEDGTRQPVLLFPPGFSPQVQVGSTWVPLDRMTVRVTEFTVGEYGYEAMPARLDNNVDYTWAAEFTVDEVGPYTPVRFSRPLPVYMENFLEWPTGAVVPSGYYDPTESVWQAEADGVVMKIVDIQNGLAVLDADGNSDLESDAELAAIGFEPWERAFLAQRYDVGQTLWRVPIAHFSTFDWNAPIVWTPTPPPAPTFDLPSPQCSSQVKGSIIDCQGGKLMEDVPVAGADLSLRYDSDRTLAGAAHTRHLELRFPPRPVSAVSMTLNITINGRLFFWDTLPPVSTYSFDWDGLDNFRRTNGIANVRVYYVYRLPDKGSVALDVPGLASPGRSFGSVSSCSGGGSSILTPRRNTWKDGKERRVTITLKSGVKTYTVGSYTNDKLGLGGWSLSDLHYYSPVTKTLYTGDGRKRVVGDLSAPQVSMLAGYQSLGTINSSAIALDGTAANSSIYQPQFPVVAPDGSVYFLTEEISSCFWKITPDGQLTRLGTEYYPIPSNPSSLCGGLLMTVDAKHRLYVGIGNSFYRMEYTSPGPVKWTRLGGPGLSGDPTRVANPPAWSEGSPIKDRLFGNIHDVAFTPDGTMYVMANLPSTASTDRIIAVQTNGSTRTLIASIPTTLGTTYGIRGLETDHLGRLLILDNNQLQVLSYTGAGEPLPFAGAPSTIANAQKLEDGPQERVRLRAMYDLAATASGQVFLIEEPAFGVTRARRLVNGELLRVPLQGVPSSPHFPYVGSTIYGRPRYLATGPGSKVVFGDARNHRLLQLESAFGEAGFRDETALPTDDSELEDTCASYPPGLTKPAACSNLRHYYRHQVTEFAVPSQDGNELYYFDSIGMHLATVDARTGDLIRTFGYDEESRLAVVTNYHPYARHVVSRQATAGGETVTIGDTVLTIDSAQGLSRIAYGASSTPATSWEFEYFDGGLLRHIWDPRANSNGARSGPPYEFEWSDVSAPGSTLKKTVLVSDRDPTGAAQTFSWDVGTPEYVAETSYICGNPYISNWKFVKQEATVARRTGEGRVTTYHTVREADGDPIVDPGASTPRFDTKLTATVTAATGAKTSWGDPDSQGFFTRSGTFLCGTGSTSPCWSEQVMVGEDKRLGGFHQFEKQRILAIPSISSDGPLPSSSRSALTYTVSRARDSVQADADDPTTTESWTETTSVVGGSVTRTSNKSFLRTTTGYVMTYTSPEGRVATATYDAWGKLVQTAVGGQTPARFGYDSQRRLFDLSQAKATDLRSTSLSFDQSSDRYPTSATSMIDLTRSVTTQMVTDQSTGFTASVTVPGIGTVTMEPTPDLQLGSVTPPQRPKHELAYNEVENLSSYGPPGTHAIEVGPNDACPLGAQCYQYNKDRQLTKLTLADGQSVVRSFAATTGLLSNAVVSGFGTATFNYDADARLTSAAIGSNTLTFGYQAKLPVRTTWGGQVSGVLRTFYNNFLEVDRLQVVNGFDAKYAYDKDGLVTGVTNNAGGTSVPAFAVTRSPLDGRVTATTLSSVTTSTTYDSNATNPGFGDLTGLSASRSGSSVFFSTYTRDKLGRILQRREATAGGLNERNYTYDDAGRLTHVRNELGTLVAQWDYDANGNRMREWTVENGERLATCSDGRATNDLDQLCSYGGRSYSYDARGTVRTVAGAGGTTTYTYDAQGLLIQVDMPGNNQVKYVYDALGRRIAKQKNGAFVKKWLYVDGLRPIAQLDASGAVEATFVYGTRAVPDYMVFKNGSTNTTYRVIADHLGTPRVLVDVATGTVAQRMDSDEFGRVTSDTNPGFQPFGFAGGLYDPDTGLVRFGARDYDAFSGRWTARDPILFGGGQANLYAYVGSDPVNRTDPTGLDPLTDLIGGVWGLANVISGGDVSIDYQWYGFSQGGFGWAIVVEDAPLQRWADPKQAVTLGHVSCYPEPASEDWLRHETAHAVQYEWLDAGYLPLSIAGLAGAYMLTGNEGNSPLESGPRDGRAPQGPHPAPWRSTW